MTIDSDAEAAATGTGSGVDNVSLEALEEKVLLAAEYCLWDVVKEMLSKSSDVAKAVHEKSGRTLLHFAARFRAPTELIQDLILLNPDALSQHAFSVGDDDDEMFSLTVGNTPLHEACRGPGLMLPDALENLKAILAKSHEDILFGEVL
jgi:ankyrin repeat protein